MSDLTANLTSNNGLVAGLGQISKIQSLLNDGNTVAWYIYDKLLTITKDGSDLVSEWRDFLGSGNDLLQAVGGKEGVWGSDGISFDGISQFMKALTFTLAQPTIIYIVFQQVSWTANDRVFDGHVHTSGMLLQGTSTPKLTSGAPTPGVAQSGLNVGDFGIIRCVFSGVNSKLIINNEQLYIHNAGTNDMSGFTLGATGAGTAFFGNILVKDVILRGVDENEDDEVDIYNYLNTLRSINKPDERNTFNSAKFIITFDDAVANQYTDALPFLNGKGVKASFSIPTDWVGIGGYMTWAQINELKDNGMDLACHGETSVNFTTLSESDLKDELQAVNVAFLANDLESPIHTFYPGGGYNDNVKTWISGYRVSARTIEGSNKIFRKNDKYVLPGGGIDDIDGAGITALKAKMDNAILWKSALVVYCHGITVAGGAFSVSKVNMEEIIDYAIANGMDIITWDEMYNLM